MPPLNLKKKVKFIVWLILQIIYGFFDKELRLLFREKVMLKIFDFSDINQLPKAYYFHNNWLIFKPLWTYYAEEKGIDIILYFYSTNIFTLLEKGKNEELLFNPWLFTKWKKIFVWNAAQEKFINRRSAFKPEIFKVGPIPFYTSRTNFNFEKNGKFKIIVFDVQPMRQSFYCSLAPYIDIYNVNFSKQFFEDINRLAKEINAQVYFKRKRHSDLIDKEYLSIISILKIKSGWIEIDPEINSFSLLEFFKPNLSINMPFTSTHYVSKFFKVPSVFYDSQKIIDKSKYDHLDLVNDFVELKKIVNDNHKKFMSNK